MMINQKEILELGHFVGDIDGGDEENFQALLEAIEDGMILPCEWEVVDDTGAPASVLAGVFGRCEFASFVEIPQDSFARWETSGYGLGFTPEFLARQTVEPVTYVQLDAAMDGFDAEEHLREGLSFVLENWDSLRQYREMATTALTTVRSDPDKRAYLHQMITGYANNSRTYYEVLEGETEADIIREWRGTAPVHFTLDDVQTIYVPSMEKVATLRMMHPTYRGTFVVLDDASRLQPGA